MRRLLASLMALIMLMSSFPVLAEDTNKSETKQTVSTTGGQLKETMYTEPISKVEKIKAGYAVLLRDANICSDQQLTKEIASADEGEIVYAMSRKGYGTSKDRVKVTFACKNKTVTGWVAAKHLRLIDPKEAEAYEKKAQKNKKAVRWEGKFLLNISAYTAPTKAPSVTQAPARDTLPATAITSLKTTSAGMSLQWRAIEGATKYQVYRSTKKTTGFKRIATVTTNKYVDATVARNNAYYYYITAVNASGTGAKSATKGRWNDFGPAVKFTRDANGNVTISWGSKKNAVSYAVYRAPKGLTTYKKIATVKGKLSYVDKEPANGETYSYFVQANYTLDNGVSISGSQGARKEYTFGVTDVASVTAANVATGMRISWPAVDNATGYRVLYRANTTASWTTLKTTTASTLYFNHTAPVYGRKIQYSVRTVGKLNGKTVYGSPVIVSTVAVGQPAVSVTSPEDGVAEVSWTAAKGATGYEVTMTCGSTTVRYEATADELTAILEAPASGSYAVTVRAFCDLDGERYYGRVSNTAAVGVTAVDPSTIPVMTAALSSAANMLDVSWQKVDNATGYMVEVLGDGWTLNARVDADTTSKSFAVNEGAVTVMMYAEFASGAGRYCEPQELNADWADGLRLTAPNATVTQLDDYRRVHVSWDAIDGATVYQMMISDVDFGWSDSEPSVETEVPGNGTYTFNIRAEAALANGMTVIGPWYEQAHTFAWTDAQKIIPVIDVNLDEPNFISVMWNEVEGAEQYDVQVYGENNGWLVQDSTTATEILIPVNGGENVRVYVRSVVNGTAGEFCDPVTILTNWDTMIAMTAPTVTYSLGTKPRVTIEWDEVEGADSYLLLVTAAGEGAGEYEVDGTGYDLTVTPETPYQFNVIPVSHAVEDGILGPRSAFVNCYPVWSEATVPEMYAGIATDANVLLVSWDALAQACIYEVAVNGSDGSVLSWEGEGNAAAFAVNGGVTYSVKMRSLLTSGDYGEWCEAQTVEAVWDSMTVLTAPVVTLTLGDEGKVNASWTEIPGAEKYLAYVNGANYPVTLTGTTYEADAEVGETFTLKVKAAASTRAGDFSGPAGEASIECYWAVDITAVPRNVTADVSVTNYVTFTWDACYGAVGYRYLYDGVLKTVETNDPLTLFAVDSGEERTFKICALYDVDGETVSSEYVTLTYAPIWDEPAIDLPKPVVSVALSEDPNYLEISWNEIEDATSYTITVAGVLPTGDWGTSISKEGVTGTSCKLWVNAGETYYVAVAAVREADGMRLTSGYSANAEIAAAWDDALALAAPEVTLAASDTPNYLHATWTEVEGATGYQLELSADGYAKSMTVTGTSATLPVPGNGAYYVSMYAYAEDKTQRGPWSNQAAVTTGWAEADTLTLSAPVVSVDVSVANVIGLEWPEVDGAEGYVVEVYNGDNHIKNVRSVLNFYSELVNGNGSEYSFRVYARATHAATGDEILSASGDAKAVASWADGVALTKRKLSFASNSINSETNEVEVFVRWTPEDGAVYYELIYWPDGGSGQQVDAGLDGEVALELLSGETYHFYMNHYFMVNGSKVWGPSGDEQTYVPSYGVDTLAVPEMTLSIDADGYVCVTWEQDPNAFSYTITYGVAGETAATQYVEAYTGEDYDVPVTSWHFKPEAGAKYEISMCANWEEDGSTEHGPSCEAQSIKAVLDAPVLTLTQSDTPNELHLSWTKVNYADRYSVSIRDNDADQRTCVVDADTTEITIFVNNNTTYTVQIAAEADFEEGHILTSSDPEGSDSAASGEITVRWDDGVSIAAPENLTLTAGDRYGVVLASWDAVENVTGYRVYCTADDWTKEIAVTGNSAEIELPVSAWWSTLTVTIRTLMDNGSEYGAAVGAESEEASITPVWSLPAEVVVAQSETPNYIDVKWAETASFDYYQVTIESETPYSFRTVEVAGSEGGIALLANNNTSYEVTVTARMSRDGNTLETLENKQTVTTDWTDGVNVLPPANVQAVLGDTPGEVIVTWDAVPGVTSYRVCPDAPDYSGDGYDVTVPASATSATLVIPEYAWFETLHVSVLSYLTDGVEEENYGYVWSDSGTRPSVALEWLVAPAVTLTAQGDNCLEAAWDAVPGAISYDLYLQTNGSIVLVGLDGSTEDMVYVEWDNAYLTADDEEILPGEDGFVKIPGATASAKLWVNAEETVSVYVVANYPDGAAGQTPASAKSETVSQIATGTHLSAPVLAAAPGDEGYVNVAWQQVEGAEGYVVVQIIGDCREDVLYDADTFSASIVIPEKDWGEVAYFHAFAYVDKSGEAGYPDDYWLEGKVSSVSCTPDWNVELTAPVMTIDTSDRGWLTLTWDAIPGATTYRVFYKESSASGYSNVYVDGSETSLQLPAANDSTYRVYMRAVHVSGSGTTTSGPACSAQSVTTAWTGTLSAPALTVAIGAKGVLELSWTRRTAADGYVLYYKESSAADYTALYLDAETLAYSLPVTQEATYNLYVCAFEGDESLPYLGKACAVQTVFATWAVNLDKPVMTLDQQAKVYYKLRVSWESVTNATRYRIFYKEESASGYSNLFVEGDQNSCQLDVENGKTYLVYMRAIHVDEDSATTSGPICAIQTITVYWPDPVVPTPALTVTPVSGDAATTTLQAEWTVPDEYCGYVLYYRVAGEETYSSMDVTDLGDEPVETFTYPTGTELEFYMQAYFMAGEKKFLGEATETITVKAAYGVHALTAPEMTLSMVEKGYISIALDEQIFATHYRVYYREAGAATFASETFESGAEVYLLSAEEDKTYEIYAVAIFEENGEMLEGPACDAQEVYAYWPPAMLAPTMTLTNDFNGKVTVAWTAVEGVTSYRLGYGTGDADWTLVEDISADTLTYELRLETLTTYSFQITPVHTHNGFDYVGNACAKQSLTTLGAPTLTAPVMTLKLGEKGYVEISWSAVANATHYSIFYKASADEAFTNVKVDSTVTSYTFPVELSDTYTVYMRAIHEDGEIITTGAKCANQTIYTEWVKYRALLIGQTYPGTTSELPGPDVDARAVGAMLATMSATPYTTTLKFNLTASGILSAISSAFAGADEDSVSLFYYSGHGVQSYGSTYHGALCGTGSTYVTVSQLRAALDQIPGKKIVLLDSCHSGEHIGKSVTLDATDIITTVSRDELVSFNNEVIAVFSARSRSNLAADEYYVITASRSDETSQSMGNSTKYVGVFTHALLYGSGYDEWYNTTLSSLYADSDGNGLITLHEAYTYAYNGALNGVSVMPASSGQHAQVYPTNSTFLVWGR